MKYSLFIYLFLELLNGCNNSRNNVVENIDTNIKKATYTKSEKEETIIFDTLSIKQVLINQESFFLSYLNLKKKKRDSIVLSEWPCGHPFEWKNDTVDFWSYHTKHLEYITNKEEAILYSGKFEGNKLKVKNQNIEFTTQTKLSEFESLFPNSYKSYLRERKLNPENYIEYDYINIAFNKDQPEDHWVFYFKNGLLFKFELYWWLC